MTAEPLLPLESIVKFDSSLSICSFKGLIGELECIVKFDFSLSGEDFKDKGCRIVPNP